MTNVELEEAAKAGFAAYFASCGSRVDWSDRGWANKWRDNRHSWLHFAAAVLCRYDPSISNDPTGLAARAEFHLSLESPRA